MQSIQCLNLLILRQVPPHRDGSCRDTVHLRWSLPRIDAAGLLLLLLVQRVLEPTCQVGQVGPRCSCWGTTTMMVLVNLSQDTRHRPQSQQRLEQHHDVYNWGCRAQLNREVT